MRGNNWTFGSDFCPSTKKKVRRDVMGDSDSSLARVWFVL